ncbi:PLD nuclease N-terminal domain-containing protein [Microbacterium sp. NPDC057659]|uniref:PLD nuclease N-terminal domain-containing protein n=1 Tax=Microbacterium sp. NPDC057659 TaxID=3346198 RepID=UPI00366C6748
MARVLIVGGFLAVVFWVFSIVDCAAQPATRHRGVSKGAWVAIVVLIPVIGGILWFLLGRRRKGDRSDTRPYAPDDDSEFLRGINRKEQDARIRELEEELARLDDDGDHPDPRS